jgi:DNA-binding transcriptional ArsR family regulator
VTAMQRSYAHPPAAEKAGPTISPMGTLRDVLEALSDPVRLEMVRRMAAEGAPVACSDLYDTVSKSTASHHFKVLREAGLTERLNIGGQTHQRLRVDDLEESFPGVVSSIVAASRD